MEIIKALNGVFWGSILLVILLGAGIFFTIRLKGIQFRYFGKMFSGLKSSMKNKGGVSGFAALCTALGGQVGTGNLVGVATAIASGGPGAVFWMWVTAVVGMATSFMEVVLAQIYKEKNQRDGTFVGGPAYYMRNGLKSKALATFYSIVVIIGIGMFYAMLQSNSIAASVAGISSIPKIVPGILVMVATALVIFGGIKRLSTVASIIVPFMAVAYLIVSAVVVVMNASALPSVLAIVFQSAFNVQAVAGGVAGFTMKEAVRYGVARGLFSNDAGSGTVATLHASAEVKHPVSQGISGMLGVFIDTIVICTCTAAIILVTGAPESGLTGIELTQHAMTIVMGKPGAFFIFLAMLLFGFTTLLADIYIGETNIEWFLPNNKKAILAYRLLICVLIVVGALAPVADLWEMVDFTVAFMVFANVIALLALSKKVVLALKNYEHQRKSGIEEPVWDYEKTPEEQ